MPKYQTLGILGQGAMGVVYRALDPALNREVALKVLRKRSDTRADEVLTRFRREMVALTKLSHPNIVKIFDVDEVEGQLCYAMELLTARSLLQMLQENGAFPVELVVPILDQLLDALDHIHEKGLLHRDIKPANIMLEDSGRAVLMDFGLVRPKMSDKITATGAVIGTPRYLAPEVLRGKQADARSDLWSLGVVAYELLAGEHPFEPANSSVHVSQLLAAVMNADPEPLAERRPDLPRSLCSWVERCMVKDPQLRFADAAEAHEAMGEVAGELDYKEAVERGLSSMSATRRSLTGLRRSMGRRSLAPRHRKGSKRFALYVAFACGGAFSIAILTALALLGVWH